MQRRPQQGQGLFSVVQINKKVPNCPFNSMFLIKHPAQSDYITKTNIQSGIKPEDQLQSGLSRTTVLVLEQREPKYSSTWRHGN